MTARCSVTVMLSTMTRPAPARTAASSVLLSLGRKKDAVAVPARTARMVLEKYIAKSLRGFQLSDKTSEDLNVECWTVRKKEKRERERERER
jgi:hypothetical protein